MELAMAIKPTRVEHPAPAVQGIGLRKLGMAIGAAALLLLAALIGTQDSCAMSLETFPQPGAVTPFVLESAAGWRSVAGVTLPARPDDSEWTMRWMTDSAIEVHRGGVI